MSSKELKLLGMALKALFEADRADKVKEIIDEMAESEKTDEKR